MKFERITSEKEFKEALLNQKVNKELARDIRISIDRFFNNNGIIRSQMEITDISTKKIKEILLITITLNRPGLLIGKAGERIDALEKYLKEYFEKAVKIHIEESRLWDYNFNYEEKRI